MNNGKTRRKLKWSFFLKHILIGGERKIRGLWDNNLFWRQKTYTYLKRAHVKSSCTNCTVRLHSLHWWRLYRNNSWLLLFSQNEALDSRPHRSCLMEFSENKKLKCLCVFSTYAYLTSSYFLWTLAPSSNNFPYLRNDVITLCFFPPTNWVSLTATCAEFKFKKNGQQFFTFQYLSDGSTHVIQVGRCVCFDCWILCCKQAQLVGDSFYFRYFCECPLPVANKYERWLMQSENNILSNSNM